MEQAIQTATPDYSEIEQLKTQQVEIEQELKKIKMAKNRLLDLAEKDAILESDIKDRMAGHREREYLLTSEMFGIKSKMESIPFENQIKYNAQIMRATIQSIYSSGMEFRRMSFDERRKLAQFAFNGKDQDGNRAGLYIRQDKEAEWSFTIKGIFSGVNEQDFLPMEPWKANALLGIEDHNYNPFENSELKSLSSDHFIVLSF